MKSILTLSNITKKFGDIEVLKSVSLSLQPGEIHGLVGENGAGKSTLLSILFGRAEIKNSGGYSGDIYLDDNKVTFKRSNQAVKLGIGMVHQEFALIPEMTVTENIKMGRENILPLTKKLLGDNLACIDKEKNRKEVGIIFKKLGVNIDPGIKVLNLSINFKHFIEFARESSKTGLKVLILDEPTAALGAEDADKLLAVLKELSLKGTAIIFVSHRLEEIVSICHKVTVLRNGAVVAAYTKDQFNIPQIAEDMVGRTITEVRRQKRATTKKVIMKFRDFCVQMPGEVLKDFNLDIYQGEIIGLAGLAGHGKPALGSGVLGLYPSSGTITLDEYEITTSNTAGVISRGIYLLPGDRRQAGLLTEHSIMDNIIFTAVQQKNKFLRKFFCSALSTVDKRKSSAYVLQSIAKLDIRCKNLHQKVKFLSGGNQQKVCLARAMAMEPKVLFISEPTRGIDIGAKEIILEAILKNNQELGTTIILDSSELGELKRVCDRIIVLYEGEIFGVFSPDCPDLEFSLAFFGKRLKQSV